MSRLTYSQKTTRVLKFLEASVDARVHPLLAAAGYTNPDVEEGWNLLRSAGLVRKIQKPPVAVAPRSRELLDRFENYWLPIVSASLKRRYPEVHAEVFQNLGRESGAEVALNVSIFLDRVQTIMAGPQGQEIATMLASRGFTSDVINDAQGLVAQFKTALPAPPSDQEDLKKKHEVASEEMWAWYLEWSTIARAVVTNRRHLRMMGFLTGSGAPRVEEEEGDLDADEGESGFPSEDTSEAELRIA